MDRRVRISSLVLLIALVLSLGLTFSAQAQSSDPGGAGAASVAAKVISPKEQAAALASWTRKAIASAQPMEVSALQSSAELDTAAPANQEAIVGAAGASAAGASAAGANVVAKRAYAADWSAIAKTAAATPAAEDFAGTSQVYDFYYANTYYYMWNMYPHKWVGRLSFSTPTGTSYCSATAISGNVMLTAAHCVYDTTNNRWYSGWVFSPAYRAGATPFGTFAATTCWVLTNWINQTGSFSITGWTKYDVAVCKMGKNSAGQTLNGAVGFMGRTWNGSYTRHIYNLGYPWRNYTNTTMANAGLYLRACVAETFVTTTDTMGSGCYYGPGISGGPWMVGYQPAVVAGYANGVNSGLYINQQNLYSIRFTSSNIVPLCTAAVC
jgi:V8-like Glu-specific endopeptidase